MAPGLGHGGEGEAIEVTLGLGERTSKLGLKESGIAVERASKELGRGRVPHGQSGRPRPDAISQVFPPPPRRGPSSRAHRPRRRSRDTASRGGGRTLPACRRAYPDARRSRTWIRYPLRQWTPSTVGRAGAGGAATAGTPPRRA